MRSAVCRRLAARKSLFCPHAIKFLRRRTDSIDIFGHFCKNPIRLSKNTAQIITAFYIGSACSPQSATMVSANSSALRTISSATRYSFAPCM